MVKRVLVTGGAGFIGRTLVRLLVEDDYKVTVLDNYRIGGEEHIPQDLRERATWVEGDVRQAKLLDELVQGADGVIHLAAPSSFLMYEEEPIEGTTGTIHGFLNVLEAMRKHGKRKLAYASTSAVYEGNPFPYTEDMPLDPPDLKALSKKVNEEMAKQYSSRYGIQAIGLRPFSVYGHDEFSKGGYANITSLFVWAMLQGNQPIVWGNGAQTRDFIFVEDVARAFQLSLESDLETQVFNVGTGVETSFSHVIDLINKYLGSNLEPIFVDVPISIYAYRLLADTSRAEERLGFRAEIELQEGIRRVIEASKEALEQNRGLGRMQKYYESLPAPTAGPEIDS